MGKFIKRAILVVLVLLIVGVIVGFFLIDRIAASAVREGGTYALDVPTNVDSVDLKLTSGETSVNNLVVSNPKDPAFKAPHFFKLDHADVAITLSSLRQDEIEIPRFELSGIDMHLEKVGEKSNYGTIITNLKRFESDKKPEEQPAEGEQKHVVIRDFVIRDLTVHAKMEGEGLTRVAAGDMTIRIPEIHLKDVGTKTTGDQVVAQLWDVVMKAVLEATFQKATQLPTAMLEDLGGSLEGLSDLGAEVIGEAGQLVEDVAGQAADQASKAIEGATEEAGRAVEGVSEGAGNAVEEAGEGAKRTVEDVSRGIGGLLGGGDKEEESADESR